MTAFLTHLTTTLSFKEKVTQRLGDLGLSMSELADQLGMPERKLLDLCCTGNPCLIELEQFGQALRVPPTYFFNGSFNQAGNGNTLTIEVNGEAARHLADQLSACHRALDASEALVAAKDEIIALLRERT